MCWFLTVLQLLECQISFPQQNPQFNLFLSLFRNRLSPLQIPNYSNLNPNSPSNHQIFTALQSKSNNFLSVHLDLIFNPMVVNGLGLKRMKRRVTADLHDFFNVSGRRNYDGGIVSDRCENVFTPARAVAAIVVVARNTHLQHQQRYYLSSTLYNIPFVFLSGTLS
ncbi:hypothetical protein HanIR_Chr07g0311161 [Helianthus annuus]|nr:hypothetical protein HanIR_Chr07g0311161 [Helianthus annuus]